MRRLQQVFFDVLMFAAWFGLVIYPILWAGGVAPDPTNINLGGW